MVHKNMRKRSGELVCCGVLLSEWRRDRTRTSFRVQALQERAAGAEGRAATAEAARDAAVTKTAQMEAALHSQLAFLQVRRLTA